MRTLTLLATAALLAGCPGDSGCDPDEETSLVIGIGAADQFTELMPEDEVGLDVAPQGGFGVSIRALTTGLNTDGNVDVNLVTEIDGTEVGSFLSRDVAFFCQEDGRGMLWGVVVGFDPSVYSTNDDLVALDGEVVDLVVTATDEDGDVAEGRIAVTVRVGG